MLLAVDSFDLVVLQGPARNVYVTKCRTHVQRHCFRSFYLLFSAVLALVVIAKPSILRPERSLYEKAIKLCCIATRLLTTMIATSSQFHALEKYDVKPRPMSLSKNSSPKTAAKKMFNTLKTSLSVGLLSR